MLTLTSDILTLTKSIRVKFNALAKYINRYNYATHGIEEPHDPREWKYYMNLCGMKHTTNNDVYITVVETEKQELLTVELLDEFYYTRDELLKGSDYYLELIDMYPDDIDYIIGCMTPTDMDFIMNSEEGTILTYNHTLVEENENIIAELSGYISRLMRRWHIDAYAIVEDLYISSFLGVLFCNIPGKIINIRLNNIGTSKVHTYFLKQFFNSKLELWNDISLLNKKSVFWLYNNLDKIMRDIGSNETLNSLSKNIFDANGVGIAKYVIRQTTPNINSVAGLEELPYSENRHNIHTIALNNSYLISKVDAVTIETMTERQIAETDPMFGLVTDELGKVERTTELILDKLKTKNKGIENTKVLDIQVPELYSMSGTTLIEIAFNNLIYMVDNDIYTGKLDFQDPNSAGVNNGDPALGTILEFQDPNNNAIFKITPRIGLLILIKLMLHLTKTPYDTIRTINYYDIVKPDDTLDNYKNAMMDDHNSKQMIDYIHSKIPRMEEKYNQAESVGKYITKVYEFHKQVWVLDSNSENALVSSNIKQFMHQIHYSSDYLLSYEAKTIDTLLSEEGINYNIGTTYDIAKSIKELLFTLLDIRVDEYEGIVSLLTACKNILKKLTAYTTQIINTTGILDNIAVPFGNMPVAYHSNKRLFMLLETELDAPEDFIGMLDTVANDFKDVYDPGFNPSYRPSVYLEDDDIRMVSEMRYGVITDQPVTSVSIKDIKS